MLNSVMLRNPLRLSLSLVVLCTLSFAGCRSEKQAVTKMSAVEHQAQQASQLRDQERAQLSKIALPTKSRYVDVHEPGAWSNPFISFDSKMVNLRITLADANPSAFGAGGMLRPTAARRREVQINSKDLVDALIALPEDAWPYGRVVAIEESPLADRKMRPQIRRQIEEAIRQLNDLGVVVDEWPSR